MYPVVGIIGKKRVGKDTFAGLLVIGHGFTRLSFADRLKEAALAADPIVGYGALGPITLRTLVLDVGWEKAKERGEVRGLLQRFGSGLRAFDPEVWIRPVQADIIARVTPVVITDVRFANEAAMIRRMGGRLVRIERPSVDDGDTHASETALPEVEADVLIQNGSTIDDLVTKVPAVLAMFDR